MKNLKYRIKEYVFPTAPRLFSAQYMSMGIWMTINQNITGNFFFTKKCYFYTFGDAAQSIVKHKNNRLRKSEWRNKLTYKIGQ